MPRGIYIVCMRTSIYVNHCRILLCLIEISRANQAIVEVCHAISSLDSAAKELWCLVSLPRVSSCEDIPRLLSLGIGELHVVWNSRLGVVIYEIKSGSRERSIVYATSVVEESALSCLNVYRIDIHLERISLIAKDNHRLCLLAETKDFSYYELTLSDLLEHLAFGVHEIEVHISVLLAPEDKLAVVPWEERNRMLWLYIFLVALFVECAHLLTCSS